MRDRGQRRLATVLFVDIIDSTRTAADVGDVRWRELVRAFRAVVRSQLRQSGGHEVDTAGDGFFAWFERPAGALRAAAGIVSDVQQLGLDVRCGVHTGELETIDGRLGGIAAHIGARVMAAAGPAEVFVTNTMRELVVGGDAAFELVGETELKGVPGRWALHRLTTLAGVPLPAPLDPAAAAALRAPGTVAAGRRRGIAWTAIAGAIAISIVAVYMLRGVVAGPAPSASASPTLAAGPTQPSDSLPPSASPTPSPSPFPISLIAIDPVTNRLTNPVRDEFSTFRRAELIVADGNLWVNEEIILRRRDIATGEYIASLELPPQTWKVQFGVGALWIGHHGPVVDRVDPLSFRVTGRIDPGEPLWDGTLGGGSLYLLTQDSMVIEYDHLLDTPLPRTPVDVDPIGTETDPAYIHYRDGMLYFCECGERREAKFDTDSDQIVEYLEGDRFRLGGALREPGTGTLWLINYDARTVRPFETEAGPAGDAIGLKGPPRQVAFGFSSVWVAAEGWVYRIASGGADVAEIAMPEGGQAMSVGVDEETNRVWVSLCYGICPR